MTARLFSAVRAVVSLGLYAYLWWAYDLVALACGFALAAVAAWDVRSRLRDSEVDA